MSKNSKARQRIHRQQTATKNDCGSYCQTRKYYVFLVNNPNCAARSRRSRSLTEIGKQIRGVCAYENGKKKQFTYGRRDGIVEERKLQGTC